MLAQKIKLPHCNLYWLVYLAKCEVEVGSLPQLIYYNTGQIWQSVYSSSAGQLFTILLPTDEQLPYIVTETN